MFFCLTSICFPNVLTGLLIKRLHEMLTSGTVRIGTEFPQSHRNYSGITEEQKSGFQPDGRASVGRLANAAGESPGEIKGGHRQRGRWSVCNHVFSPIPTPASGGGGTSIHSPHRTTRLTFPRRPQTTVTARRLLIPLPPPHRYL